MRACCPNRFQPAKHAKLKRFSRHLDAFGGRNTGPAARLLFPRVVEQCPPVREWFPMARVPFPRARELSPQVMKLFRQARESIPRVVE